SSLEHGGIAQINVAVNVCVGTIAAGRFACARPTLANPEGRALGPAPNSACTSIPRALFARLPARAAHVVRVKQFSAANPQFRGPASLLPWLGKLGNDH
ncbi:MAG TPA: hypothetical protein VGM03_24970, partial [Phycisphaerae bacterium]